MARYASGKYAYGYSDRSGFRYKLSEMTKEWNGMKVKKYDEYESKHPQLEPRPKGADAQALKILRPDQDIETTAFTVYTNVGDEDVIGGLVTKHTALRLKDFDPQVSNNINCFIFFFNYCFYHCWYQCRRFC